MSHPEARATSEGARSIDLRDEVGVLRSRLAVAEAAFFGIVERSSDGILVVDRQGLVRFANAAAFDLLGRSRADLIDADVGFAVLGGDVAEVELVRPGGEVVFAEMRVVDTEWDGQPCLLALLRDVTDRHQVQEELARRATHDHLTGLPNRFLLEDRIEHALDGLSRRGGSVALFMGDLDDFKAVNDRFGHAAGDAVLIEAARRIRSALRPVDTVARFGGDEFVMLCESMDQTGASELSARLALAFRKPFTVGAGVERTIGLSVGFVLADQPGTRAEELLVAADERMYAHKPQRGGESTGDTSDRHLPETRSEAPVPTGVIHRFTLYVAGVTDRSVDATEHVDSICRQHLPEGSWSVRVVDVLRSFDEADSARVLMTPTLVRHEPLPALRIIGDLSNAEALAAELGLVPRRG